MMEMCIRIHCTWGAWLAQLVEHVTPDLQVVSLSSMLGVEIKNTILKKKKKKGIDFTSFVCFSSYLLPHIRHLILLN